MKKSLAILAGIMIFNLFAHGVYASRNEAAKVDDATEVIQELIKIPEKSIPPTMLSTAQGIAIIPGVIKAGFILGGRYGTGVMMIRDKDGWSNPVFITLAGGSIGWQIGVESIDIILVFKSSRSVGGILKGKFTLGADAAVAAGPVGRSVSAGTDVQLKSEIYSYSRSRGLFAGLALEGAALQIDDDADDAFYGKALVTPKDIIDRNLTSPPQAERLKNLLSNYSTRKPGTGGMSRNDGTDERQ